MEVLGTGGFSTVYKVKKRKESKIYAMKVMPFTEGRQDFETHCFHTEVEILKQIKHKNIPFIVEEFETNRSFIIVMEYVSGITLEEDICKHGAFSVDKVVHYGLLLCKVVNYLHKRKSPIVYGDMKPANVMLKPDGNIILIDFGCSMTKDILNNSIHYLAGTKEFSPPECLHGLNRKRDILMGQLGDIYALGKTMKFMLLKHSQHAIKSTEDKGLDNMMMIINRAINPNPLLRYNTVKQLEKDLLKLKQKLK